MKRNGNSGECYDVGLKCRSKDDVFSTISRVTHSVSKNEMGSVISSLLFQPPSISYKRAKKIIWLKSKDGVDIPAIYIDKKSTTTILFSHGNAEDLGRIYEWLVTISCELRVRLLLQFVACVP